MSAAIGLIAATVSVVSICRADLPRVAIVVGAEAPRLERFAADELKSMLERLYRVQVGIQNESANTTDYAILLGRETTNPQVREALPQPPVTLSDQGLQLQTVDPSRLIVRGGSPMATLWAAYELGEQLGIRYLTDRDVYPTAEPVAWKPPPELKLVMEPNLRIRCWRLLNEHAMGPISWSLEENRRFLKQIAKMKFNRVHLFMWPAQPFVDYTFRGVSKGPGVLFFGARYSIDSGTIGRERFGKMTEFTNPEFVGAASPAEVHQRAVALAQGIFGQARELGMATDLSLMATEWPKHFQSVLPGAEAYAQVGNLTCGPGKNQSVDDPNLHDMLATVIRAHIETYPEIDYLRLSLSEHPAWYGQAEECYRRLSERYDMSNVGTFEELCAKGRARTSFPGGGERVERWVRESLACVYLVDKLVRERELLKRPGGGPDIRLTYTSIPEELFPLMTQLLPPEGEVVSFVDYTASRQLQRADLLQITPPEGVKRQLTMTLADDNVGVLPQLATGSIHKLLAELRAYRWAGFSTRYWIVGEQDPAIHYLARASWNAEITPAQAYTDQVSHVCGPEAVEAMLNALTLIEGITAQMDQHFGVGMPVETMMTQFYDAGGLSAELQAEHALYRAALEPLEKAKSQCLAAGQFYLDYFIGRLRFAVRYLAAAAAFGTAGKAERSGDRAAAREQVGRAEEAIRDALTQWAIVARDHGELGAVATINEFAYRPIRRMRESLRNKD